MVDDTILEEDRWDAGAFAKSCPDVDLDASSD